MNPSLYIRSAKALAAATALSLLLAAGPGGGGPGGGRGPRSESGGNQQCPPGQGQNGGGSGQGESGLGNSGGGQMGLLAPGGGNQGENGQDQGPGGQGQGQGGQSRQRGQGQTLSGSVSGYNLNPAGTAESMMLNTGNSTVQLNFPPEMATAIQSAAAVGSQVTVVARSGGGPGGPGGPGDQGPDDQQQADHKVMNLESIKTASGGTLSVGGPGGGKSTTVTGAVKQLNYDRRGDINGAQLSNGTFVHLRPGSDADLTVGEKVSVQGRQRTASSGMKIIEAESINGTSVDNNGPGGGGPDGGGPGGGGNNGGPGAGGPPGGGPDGNGAPGQ
jgi:eukaryotic-like serine/threonine-protein kinase